MSEVVPNSPFPMKKVGEVCFSKERIDPRKSPEKKFKYVDIASVSNESFQIKEHKVYYGAEAPSRARKSIRKGDVLFATTRPYLRSIAIVPEEYDGEVCSTGFCVLRAGEDALPEWVFYSVLSDAFMAQITPKMRGANYPAVTDSDVLEGEIPVPPLAEQRRIVTRIRECLDRVEEIRRLRDESHEEAEALLMAHRHAWWSQLASDGASMMRLSDLVESFRNGLYKPAKFYGSGTLFLRMYNIAEARIDLDQYDRVQADESELSKYELQPGDILVNRVNSRELVGKSALVNGLPEPAVYEAMTIRVRLQRDVALPAFVAEMMNSPQALASLRGRAKHAIGQSSINQKDLGALEIPVPDLVTQGRIAAELEHLRSAAESLRTDLDAKAIEALPSAILRKAFAGEL